MHAIKMGEFIPIQLVTYGESFKFSNYVMEIIPIPDGLQQAADSAITAGWVPRMVRLSYGRRLLMMFEIDTLVRWMGYTDGYAAGHSNLHP